MYELIEKQTAMDTLRKYRDIFATNRYEYANLSHDDKIRVETIEECMMDIQKLSCFDTKKLT